MAIFDSLDAFRAHCGEPTMPIEQCPICSKIPVRCSRESTEEALRDDRPPEMLQLETIVERKSYREDINNNRYGAIERCPTCHRLYFYDTEFVAPSYYFDIESEWTRHDLAEMFNLEWCVIQRLPSHRVERVIWHGFFRHHILVTFEGSNVTSTLDANNQLTPLDGPAAFAALLARDPPDVTHDLVEATRFALFFDQIENAGDRLHDTFDSIVWREPLSSAGQQAVAAARTHRIEPRIAERVGEEVRVRFWVTSGQRLICRTITVQPGGRCLREDVIAADHLPLPSRRPDYLASLDAFRAQCGEPTMPLAQCPICSVLPDRCTSDDDLSLQLSRLPDFIDDYVKRCTACGRLYVYEESSGGGNDIYRGNETFWYLERHSVDSLFNLRWSVWRRLPDRGVKDVCADRFFPNHVLVQFNSKSWGALDATNQLLLLDSPEAIATLIERDPPTLTDLEVAKRYALLLDKALDPAARRPDDYELFTIKEELTPEEEQQVEEVRAATGFSTTYPWLGPSAVATREGDRVMVRSWVMSQRRLICRMHTIQPTGHVLVEDAVIAENFPVGRDRVL